MNGKNSILFLLILLLPACSTTKQQKLTEATPFKITGAYEGEAAINGDSMRVSIFQAPTDKLSTYRNVRPLIGGNRIPICFETDIENEEAEYCAFVYSDEVTFRKGDGFGLYIKEIGVFQYLQETGNIYFDIPLRYFEYKPFTAWTSRIN